MTSFVHRGFFYRDEPEWLDEVVPFLRHAVVAGEPALAAISSRRHEALRDALGTDADGVELVPIEVTGKNPGRLLSVWHDFAERHPRHRRLRGVAETVWPGRRPDEIVECQHHEQLVNVAFDDRDLELICPYDVASLDPGVIEAAHRSHPVTGTVGRHEPNPAFALDVSLSAPLSPPPADAPAFELGIHSLRDLRRRVDAHASSIGLAPARAYDLVLAVSEAMTNSVLHAQGGVLTWWDEPGRVVCEIRDAGHLTDPLVGRLRPPPDAPGGRGVWMLHQMCDLVQIRSTPAGTTVRLAMDLDD
ncbi:MAG: sensor histidine kinase [Actinobacteria bacterium]|nr:sensor histidine kinase [Actinomycetota bacterium]